MRKNGDGPTVAEQRKYMVLDVEAAKQIASIWLQSAQLENSINFGLPEVDDRYHIWRVPLLNRASKARIGRNSRIVEMARAVNGTIVQMSATFWPLQVATILHDTLGFEHELLGLFPEQVENYLREKLLTIPIESFVANLPLNGLAENGDAIDEGATVEDGDLE